MQQNLDNKIMPLSNLKLGLFLLLKHGLAIQTCSRF